jgi:peptidoglycan/xylan/chitin deacetylase (PgdA/CDA1 family)
VLAVALAAAPEELIGSTAGVIRPVGPGHVRSRSAGSAARRGAAGADRGGVAPEPGSSKAMPAFAPRGRLPSDETAGGKQPCDAGFELRVPILMYHRIVPRAAAGHSLAPLVIEPRLFAAQMTALQKAGWHTITLGELGNDLATCVSPGARTVVITFDDGYRDGYTYALPILRAHGFVATYFVITGRLDRSEYLTSGELREMAASGMEIADHTVHHIALWVLPVALLHEEIDVAAEAIEELVGARPESFAYPFGDANPRAIRVADEAGFAIAVTNVQGVSETSATRLTTPRLRVGSGISPDDLLRLLAPYAGRAPTLIAPPNGPRRSGSGGAGESAVLRSSPGARAGGPGSESAAPPRSRT